MGSGIWGSVVCGCCWKKCLKKKSTQKKHLFNKEGPEFAFKLFQIQSTMKGRWEDEMGDESSLASGIAQ